MLGVVENMRGALTDGKRRIRGRCLTWMRALRRTGLEVPVQKMRFKTTSGADVTDAVREALLGIVRVRIHARGYSRVSPTSRAERRCRIWIHFLRRRRCVAHAAPCTQCASN